MNTSLRGRLVYTLLMVMTIALGLGARHPTHVLPPWLAKSLGDALYATLVFWLVRVLRPASATLPTALAAIVFCFLIEFSQLYQWPWIMRVRHTRLGGLVLGHGFHAWDLAWYVGGVGLAIGIEALGRRVHRP